MNGNRPADHHVEIHLEKKDFTKLQRNMRNKKGFRFSPKNVLGSGFLSSALSIGKQALQNKTIQSYGKQALQKGLKMVADKSNNSLILGAANLASKQIGGRLKKGSEEAREHMAHIRAMRSGCGLFDTALSLGKKALNNKTVQSLGKQALQGIKNGWKFQ